MYNKINNQDNYDTNSEYSKKSQRKTLFLILTGVFISFVLFIMFLFFLAGALINLFPKSWENKIGVFIKNNYVIENIDEAKTNEVKKAFENLSDENLYEIYVTKNREINALALPGNIILIYEALYDKSSGDELNFVIAHELAHFKNRDHLKSFARMVFLRLALDFMGQENSSYFSSKIIELVNLGFYRNAEFKADADAINLLKSKGMRTEGTISFMNKMLNFGEKESFSYFSTHPDTKDRIKKIKKLE